MISQDSILQAARSQQTTELNVAREYCQHLFLRAFYRQAGSERVLFKGGTALRIVFGSPRFSEDLAFSGFGATVNEIETWVLEAVGDIEQHGIGIEPEAMLLEEKLNALLIRGKPRDYYDVYFMLRKGMVTVEQRPRLAEVKQKLLRSKLNLQRELALFLPRSHHAVLRDFSRTLEAELTRHGA
jgi:predicted nucleotidyltransferase component of viral defense system